MGTDDQAFLQTENRALKDRIVSLEQEAAKERDKAKMMLKLVSSKNEQIEKSLQELEEAHDQLKKGYEQTVRYYLNTVTAMANASESKLPPFAGHSNRVSQLLNAFGGAIGLPAEELDALRMAGLLHDFGNIAVPETVLVKAGPLTDEERARVQRHPAVAGMILEPIGILQRIIPDIEGHHERWDGSGYPKGLVGDDIPRGARLLSLAEVFVALTSERPWRGAYTKEQAIEVMEDEIATFFDPEITPIFLAFVQDREG